MRGLFTDMNVRQRIRLPKQHRGARRANLARVSASVALVLVTGFGISPARTDATVFTETKLTASDGAEAGAFGFSTAVDGDTLVVGARGTGVNPSGAAYVFVRNDGAWIEAAKLIPSDGTFDDEAGSAVGLSEDTAIVGAPRNDAGGDESGAAYVFVRNAGAWTQEAKLAAVDAAAGDLFGHSVAISGDTAVVGRSTQNDDPAVGVYVFTRSGTTWTQEAKLTASDGVPSEAFGAAVAVSGNTIVVGTPNHDGSGAAYVFVRNAGVWTEETKFTPSIATGLLEFGFSVSIDGETAAIGARGDRDQADFSGAAYVFVRNAGVWMLEAKLKASDPAVDDNFGHAVAISGDNLVAGAFFKGGGAAYVFERSGGLWVQGAKLTASDSVTHEGLGFSVSISGETVVAGAPFDSHEGNGAGSAYVFAPAFCLNQPDGTPCNDGNMCTSDDRCTGGSCGGDSPCGDSTVQAACGEECDDGNLVAGDGCSPTCTLESPTATPTPTAIPPTITPTPTAIPACAAMPVAGCRTPAVGQKALLVLKDKSPDTIDRLSWKWIKGAVTSKADFGTPLTTTSYQLCIYDGTPTNILSATMPAGGLCNGANPRACWREKRTGFQYRDKDATPDGITKMTLNEGLVAGKAKIIVEGKGALLDDPTFPIAQPVTVQLLNGTTCWEAVYSAPATKNTAGPPARFTDKAD